MKPGRVPGNHRKKERISFDWEAARRRIEDTMGLLSGEAETHAETLERIWQERALQLAQAPEQDADGERTDLVIIRLGREDYALPADYVYDIRPARQITLVPRVPEWVAGVVNLRGRIMSVLDLRMFFNLPAGEVDPDAPAQEAYLVVVRAGDMELALKVDQVLRVEALLAEQIKDASRTTQGLPGEYVLGLIEHTLDERTNGPAGLSSKQSHNSHSQENSEKQIIGAAVVLNLPNLLADERLLIHEELV